MKKTLLILCATLITGTNLFAKLPAAAQKLYDSAYAQDPTLVTFALTNGAQIIGTPDSSSFYIQWFPSGATPAASPVIVTLHGSHCNAFMEFKSWYASAQLHGCGIIALQWNRYNPTPPYDYFPDDTLYNDIAAALTKISYPAHKALLHGFSRGSARSYAMIFNDTRSGNNFFCTTISNSGDADPGYPLYDSISKGIYGANVFAGKHWNLFCAANDTIVGCAKMASTKTWLQQQGATVDIFIQDPALGHDGFQLPTSQLYKDSILNKYLACYNGSLPVKEKPTPNTIHIAPNPFSFATTMLTEDALKDATLTVYNLSGQQVKQVKNISGKSVTLYRDNLQTGIYFMNLTQAHRIIASGKFVISD